MQGESFGRHAFGETQPEPAVELLQRQPHERAEAHHDPTVRGRVEALVRALGFGPRADADADPDDDDAPTQAVATPTRDTILERLARHEIGADEAAAAIRALGRTTR